MTKIDVTIDQNAIVEKIRTVTEAKKKDFAAGVELALSQILIDTQAGINQDGQHVKPYSKRYVGVRAAKGLPVSPVDHFFTGAMLRSIATRVLESTPRAIVIAIFPAADQRVKVVNTNRLRKWFGFSEKAINKIRSRINGK